MSKAKGRRTAVFFASIPPMETAIKIHGEGGARLQLDIAESDLGGFLAVLPMRQMRLRVTVEAAGAGDGEGGGAE